MTTPDEPIDVKALDDKALVTAFDDAAGREDEAAMDAIAAEMEWRQVDY